MIYKKPARVTQYATQDIDELVKLAEAENAKDVIVWIIAHSPHWRSEGCYKIREELFNRNYLGEDKGGADFSEN